jgi:Flp pilus assembly pilin Flp
MTSGHRRASELGTSLVEYVLLVGLIALVALVGLRLFGTSRNNSLSRTASHLGGIVETAPFLGSLGPR